MSPVEALHLSQGELRRQGGQSLPGGHSFPGEFAGKTRWRAREHMYHEREVTNRTYTWGNNSCRAARTVFNSSRLVCPEQGRRLHATTQGQVVRKSIVSRRSNRVSAGSAVGLPEPHASGCLPGLSPWVTHGPSLCLEFVVRKPGIAMLRLFHRAFMRTK